MSIAKQMITNLAGPGFVPPTLASRKRYPFVFIIDVSGSTGDEPDPDIHHINKSISILLDTLRNPTPSSDLQKQVDSIDVCIICYSATARELLPWSIAKNLPPAVQTLTPESSTSTGAAIEMALQQIGDRLRYYRDPANNFASGMPHIIHLTDGAMNDMKPGDAKWNTIKQRLDNINGANNTEKKSVTMLHFVSPKGCDRERIDINGRMMTGQQLLAELTGKDTVFEMGREIGSFETLIKLITVAITSITKNYGGVGAVDAMKSAIDSAAIQLRTNNVTNIL
ncbi:VWA domain-containing protein [Hyphomicrobium sp.]|uniref:VWA domain-containing protein n=1 Tax=Hyphomicrobium sp. TaxID=82 RepID=UPI002E36E218|nr:VWA domain-containing protein [Hyphomicrobium sp.]HEX2842154.1 VWA domain-containing protein [Hyphomicrobium sp.]